MPRRLNVLIMGVLLCVGLPWMAGAGCNPPAVDGDGDGFADEVELNGTPATDPHDAEDNPDHVIDSDGDGCSDYEESNFDGRCDGNPHTPTDTVTIGGAVNVAATMLVDGDTSDVNNAYRRNDTIEEAQSVPNPCAIGGFLGQMGRQADVRDIYLAQMAAGQTATLLLADPQYNDFDLYLYPDSGGDPLASSEGYGNAEQVTAPGNGTFLILVYGYSVQQGAGGGGLYTLLIGEDVRISATPAARRQHLSSLAEFVEGEVIVRRAKNTPPAARILMEADLGLEGVGGGANACGAERMKITSTGKLAQAARARQADGGLRIPASPTIAAVKALARRSDVQYVEPNYKRKISFLPNDEFYHYQWNFEQIGLPQAWDTTTGSANVIVAVIDTGVVLDHPDLQGQFVSGYDFISDPLAAGDGDGIDADPNDPGDSPDPSFIPNSYHGTHVAGIIAARTNNGTGVAGVAGVAGGARIMPLRGLGVGGGTDYDVAQALLYAAGLPNDSGTVPAQPADIINMSLGGPGYSQIEQDAITAARQAGVIIITAAGNRNQNGDNETPGGLDGVVNVSAVDFSRSRSPYSNFGNSVAVAAPGGNIEVDANGDGYLDGILSTVGDQDGVWYAFYDGTSMAAPHVAGVAALMKAVNPGLSPLAFNQLLAGTHPGTQLRITDELGEAGRDIFYGYGLINALAAVRAAAEAADTPPTDTPILQIVPRDLDFGAQLNLAGVVASNGGGGTLTINSITPSDAWMSVTPTGGTASTLTYAVTVDRGGLSAGAYSGSLRFDSNGGSLAVSVRMRVGAQPATGGDVGMLYVLLVDPQTNETVEQVEVTAADGYAFTMTDVPAGEYLIYAGTDMDGNGYIDDEGEALGGYPVLSHLENLDAATDVGGKSFAVQYQINLQTPAAAGVAHNSQLRRQDVVDKGVHRTR